MNMNMGMVSGVCVQSIIITGADSAIIQNLILFSFDVVIYPRLSLLWSIEGSIEIVESVAPDSRCHLIPMHNRINGLKTPSSLSPSCLDLLPIYPPTNSAQHTATP